MSFAKVIACNLHNNPNWLLCIILKTAAAASAMEVEFVNETP